MTYEISVTREFSAAHRLLNYKGKCENIHGHNWTVKAVVASDKLNSQGMVMDFHDLKDLLDSIISKYDHICLNDLEEFNNTNPTSENIAEHIFTGLSQKLKEEFCFVKSVSVWESRDNYATVSI